MEAPPEDVEEKEDWLITYADAITLLMAFMVMLLTFSEYDIPAFAAASAASSNNRPGQHNTTPPPPNMTGKEATTVGLRLAGVGEEGLVRVTTNPKAPAAERSPTQPQEAPRLKLQEAPS